MSKLKYIVFFMVIASLLVVPVLVGAQTNIFPPGGSQVPGFEPTGSLTELLLRLINLLLALVGIIAVIFLIWGGFKYITSGGEEGALESAKKTIVYALIGVAVVILAFALVRIIYNVVIGGQGGL